MTMETQWHEFRKQLHAMRRSLLDSLSRRRPSRSAHAVAIARLRLCRVEDALAHIPLGLYPVCEACGARIEMDRLRADPAERWCWSCARHRESGTRS